MKDNYHSRKWLTSCIAFFIYLFIAFNVSASTFIRDPDEDSTNEALLWFKANTSIFSDTSCSTPATDGNQIGCWRDNSSNSNDSIQTLTASQPSLQTDITNGINFNPVVQFDGANDYLPITNLFFNTTTNPLPPITLGDFTVYSVIKNSVTSPDIILSYDRSSFFRFTIGDDVGGGNDGRLHLDTNSATINDMTGVTTVNDGLTHIVGGNYNTALSQKQLYIDGAVDSTVSAHSGADLGNDSEVPRYGFIGVGSEASTPAGTIGPNNFYNGEIAEILLYEESISGIDRQQVETYLAIKYGVTLSNTDADPTIQEGDYINSAGTVIWDGDIAGANNTFHNEVTGIGRDDDFALTQPKSKSENPESIITIGSPTSFDSGDYLVWGNDNGTATGTTVNTPPSYARLDRQWRVQETGNIGDVTIAVDVDDPDFDLPVFTPPGFLLYDSDNDGTYTDEIPLQLRDDGAGGDETASDNVWTVQGVNLDSGEEFTFAANAPSPTSITITAPTKASNSSITNTTITATDTSGINAANVTVSSLSTASTSSLNCSQTSATQVDCTISIDSSGNLVINATDNSSESASAIEAYYVIETTPPVITINAPTKTASNQNITDTTITVTDSAITASNVTIDGSSTVTTSGFSCTQISITEVQCSVVIESSGDLVINAIDDAGNSSQQTESNYTITIQGPGGIPGNLTLWFKANDLSASLSDGNSVNAWSDASANNYNASQPTATNQPTFRENTTINQNPYVEFDGTSDRIGISGLSYNSNSLSQIYTWTVFRTPHNGSSFTDNWAFLDYDRSEYFNTYLRGDTNTLGYSYRTSAIRDIQGTTTLNDDEPHIAGFVYDSTLTNDTQLRVNGFEDLSSNIETTGTLVGTTTTRFGYMGDGSEASSLNANGNNIYYNGDIAETIYYSNTTLSSSQINQIESYLAIKYGITLNNTNTSPSIQEGDYVNSNGATIWDGDIAGINATYHNDVAGIGTDNQTILTQNKSKSENNDAIVSISNAQSQDDLDYLIWGNNDGAATWTSVNSPTNYQRLTREWRVQETNDIGSVTIEFDVENTNFNIPNFIADNMYFVIVDTDNDGLFSDETPSPLFDDGSTNGDTTASDNIWTTNGIDFATGNRFTIATSEGVLTVDIVNASGVSVASPFVDFTASNVSFSSENTSGTLGINDQRVRVENSQANPAWSLSLGATAGTTALWSDGGSLTYDFNDPTPLGQDGGDGDSVGGQLTINPLAASIAPESGCTSNNITLGSSNAFSEGVLDQITLATSSILADTNCYWDFTSILLNQIIPPNQEAANYSIDMTLSIISI